jgi:superoxide dismutase
VKNINIEEEKLKEEKEKKCVRKIIRMGNEMKFNGGGKIKKKILWKNIYKNGGKKKSELEEDIKRELG